MTVLLSSKQIKLARIEFGYRYQRDLAVASGVSVCSINKAENEKAGATVMTKLSIFFAQKKKEAEEKAV